VVCCGDDWQAAAEVQVFGYTHSPASGTHPVFAGDLIRGASRGKPFWRAEAVGNSQWSGRRLGCPQPEKDAMADPDNIRLDCLLSLACGARAYQTPRWRPLLDGPLFGAFGWYAMDGSRTERSAEIVALARWANQRDVQALWKARPVRGDVACVLIAESQAFCYAMYGDTEAYARSVYGAHRAFTHRNVQCDLAQPDQIHDYAIAYVPMPVAMGDATLSHLLAWAHQGGHLVLEGCAAYFNDLAHAFPQQPNRGLAEAAGCVERSVSFALDRHDDLHIRTEVGHMPCGIYWQSYQARGGNALGHYDDGSVAIVRKAHGAGSVTLGGSMPAYAYEQRRSDIGLSWFGGLLPGTGREPHVGGGGQLMLARLWTSPESYFLWAINLDGKPCSAELTLATNHQSLDQMRVLRGEPSALRLADDRMYSSALSVSVPPRDALIAAWPAI